MILQQIINNNFLVRHFHVFSSSETLLQIKTSYLTLQLKPSPFTKMHWELRPYFLPEIK